MTYVGVDWASGRWVVVAIGDDVTVTTAPSILNVWHEYGDDADAFLVDIPIGLPDVGERACDRAASTFLADRGSSVFSIPCRDAVEAATYDDAAEACGGSLSSQSWWLFPQIREVDVFLEQIEGATDVVYESHPEVCFAALTDDALPPKSEEDGLDERIAVLADLDEALFEKVRDVVDDRADGAAWHDRLSSGRRDDVVDAAVLAATAQAVTLGPRDATPDYPALPVDDEAGETDDSKREIPMEIVVPETTTEPWR